MTREPSPAFIRRLAVLILVGAVLLFIYALVRIDDNDAKPRTNSGEGANMYYKQSNNNNGDMESNPDSKNDVRTYDDQDNKTNNTNDSCPKENKRKRVIVIPGRGMVAIPYSRCVGN